MARPTPAAARAFLRVDRARLVASTSGRGVASPRRRARGASTRDVVAFGAAADDDATRALARALSSVNAVRSGARDSFDALDARAVEEALRALVGSDGRADREELETGRGRGDGRDAAARVKKACALIREVESACVTRGCETAVRPRAMEAVARAGCAIRGDETTTLAVVRAFYTIAKKGKGATSPSHATVRTYTDVIAALSRCAAESRSNGAARTTPSPVEVWLMLRATPLCLDGAAFAAGVGAYASEGKIEEAEKLLREMTAEGVRAGPRLFNTLIAAYGREKNLRGVEASSMAMRTLGVTPNQATWGARIFAYASCDRLDLAVDALEQGIRFSPRRERRPGVEAYTALVQGFARAGRLMEADEILRRMSRDGVEPNVYTYSTLIDGLAKGAQMDPAETAFAEMRRAKIKPSVVTYNSLLKGVVRGSTDSDRAREVLNRARALFDRMRDDGVAPDLVTYNTLIDACINAREPTEAWNILREISESGLKPDVVTYTTLLKYFVQVGDDSATQWVLSEMETDPAVVQDVGVYNCLINAYARQGDMARALETLDSMAVKDIAPNIATYGTILEGYVRAGNVSEAVRVYDVCKQTNGLAPDARMRKSLIYGCGLHGMSDVADCIIADLQATGPEGAKEARKLHFVLQAAAESDAASVAAPARRRRRRRRPAKKRASSTASAVASTSDDTDDQLPEQTQPPEWNRGLEMWKHWLGLPNSYYADRAADESRDIDVNVSSRSDVTFGER